MKAIITNIQGYSLHDGPGIRTVVFLKGCPLHCRWCANPEGISSKIQIGFMKNLCIVCGKCFSICPEMALSADGNKHRIDYSKCTVCGKCVDVCNYKALVQYGSEMNVEDVFDAVARDKMFYDTSGGGVTVSGGEPLLQPLFVKALLRMCKTSGINTCVETGGFIPAENMLEILPVTDHLYFDLKHMNPITHLRYTGQANNIILSNARLAAEKGIDILFRMPLIPGVNDDDENIRSTAAFAKSLPGEQCIQLMPFHQLGDSKYQALGLENLMSGTRVMMPDKVEAVRQRFENLGVTCSVSK